MDVSRVGIDKLGQGVDIGAEELFQTSMGENVVDDWSLRTELLQHLFGCDELSGFGLLGLVHNLHLAKQHLAHLLGRCYVELVSGELVYVLFNLLNAVGQGSRCLGKSLGVEPHSVHLHFCQHRHERHLDVIEQVVNTSLLEAWLQHVV